MEIQKGKWVHTLEIPVRWYDMDALGHVNHSVFFTYFEQTRISWLNKVAPAWQSSAETGPIILDASCTFFKAIRYPETLILKMFLKSGDKSSYDFSYEISSKGNPEILYAQGATKVVWVNRKLNQSISLPDTIRHLLPET